MSLAEQGRPRTRVDCKRAIAWAASVAAANRARDYAQFRHLIDARRIELGLRMLDVDVDARLPDGYFAKLICGKRGFGEKSLGAVLAVLGVELLLAPRREP
jgi:hypothetical protein